VTYNKKRELLFPLSLFAVQIYGIYGSFARGVYNEAKAKAEAKERPGKGISGNWRELAAD